MNVEAATIIATAIRGVFESPAELDSNLEQANIVDALGKMQRAIDRHALAVEKLAEALRMRREG